MEGGHRAHYRSLEEEREQRRLVLGEEGRLSAEERFERARAIWIVVVGACEVVEGEMSRVTRTDLDWKAYGRALKVR